MEKIFVDADEKYLAAVVLYGHSDKYLYSESAHTTKVSKDDVLNLAKKGLLRVVYNGETCMPICFKENSGHAEVTIATGTDSLTSAVLYSSEYAEE